jgi:hypothetical protein
MQNFNKKPYLLRLPDLVVEFSVVKSQAAIDRKRLERLFVGACKISIVFVHHLDNADYARKFGFFAKKLCGQKFDTLKNKKTHCPRKKIGIHKRFFVW